jgi:hypothetical protein
MTWFRRRRSSSSQQPAAAVPASAPEPEEPAQAPREPEPAADPTGPLSTDRLDTALKRLRQEIPAPSEETPSGPSE